MTTGKLSRRLERLEAELTPRDKKVLTVNVTFIGHPERNTTIELRGGPQADGDGGRGRWTLADKAQWRSIIQHNAPSVGSTRVDFQGVTTWNSVSCQLRKSLPLTRPNLLDGGNKIQITCVQFC